MEGRAFIMSILFLIFFIISLKLLWDNRELREEREQLKKKGHQLQAENKQVKTAIDDITDKCGVIYNISLAAYDESHPMEGEK
jgi:cell division protein FtsB